jgi:peptide deformylase
MAVIKTYPAAILRQRAEAVQKIDSSVHMLIDAMAELMYQAEGVGLAAPQVGISQRVIVLDAGDGLTSMVNPEIFEMSEEQEKVEEGCLSLPGVRVQVHRPKSLKIRGIDERGETVEITAEGLLARVFQHEIDHLNGVLIVDHASMIQKTFLKSKLKHLYSQ